MNILVKCIAGSHLFGTNTEKSDKDFKGIFLPTKEEILLGKLGQTIHQNTNQTNQKNTSADIDSEFYSLDKWLKMLYEGQTVAWELLFTPDSHIIEKHPLWDEIRTKAPLLVNRKVDAFIGYCKQQANRYGTRGSRMGTLEKVIYVLEQYDDYTILQDLDDDLSDLLKLEHVELLETENNEKMLSVIGKKFVLTTRISYVLSCLNRVYENYGERSRLAKNNAGIDWKALSHAVRVCYQAERLLKQGTLQMPLPENEVTVLKEIKAGAWTFEQTSNYLEERIDALLKAREESHLPEFPNKQEFEKIQLDIFTKIVVEST